MKVKTSLLLSVALLFSVSAFAQTVSGVTAVQEGNNIIVSYNISKPAPSVVLTVSTDGGKTFSQPLTKIAGDVTDVTAGNHMVIWDVLSEYGSLTGDNIVFNVTPVAYRAEKKKASDFNGHNYVDLGLSVKWATCNVGARGPEDRGDFLAWGGLKKDPAHICWGGTWRVPSAQEWNELRTRCAWEWTTYKGHKGYMIVSRVKGYEQNWIFLRADGYKDGRSVSRSGANGYYWTSSMSFKSGKAISIRFNFVNVSQTEEGIPGLGFSIRPVSD